jgi:hypothetical protein
MLGLLNVGYVISEFDLLVDGLILDRIVDGARIYKNEYSRSPAWLQPGDADKNVEIIPTENLTRKPNQLSISAAGPGKLVISEVAYPGWKVRIDGVEHELLVSEEILMGVELTSGMHQVDFLFRPVSVYIGLFLFCTGLAFLGWNLKRDKQLNSKPE